MINLKDLSVGELLKLQSLSLEELRTRNILRSNNNPTGDLSEYLFCRAFKWEMSNNSQNGFDATDSEGLRYQIKGRQIIKDSHSERQLSAIRDLEKQKFDFMAGVLLDKNYAIYRAAIIPYKVIVDSKPYYAAHDNKHIFYLRDSVWDVPSVKDVTKQLKEVAELL